MGQDFKLVNLDKKEVVNSWDIGSGAKFWNWMYNQHARVVIWLLRASDEGGGGDIYDREQYTTLGRWAGDRITLIGDYDASELWFISRVGDGARPNTGVVYTDISTTVRGEFNDAVRRDGGGKVHYL